MIHVRTNNQFARHAMLFGIQLPLLGGPEEIPTEFTAEQDALAERAMHAAQERKRQEMTTRVRQ
jgi:hypothetical protein